MKPLSGPRLAAFAGAILAAAGAIAMSQLDSPALGTLVFLVVGIGTYAFFVMLPPRIVDRSVSELELKGVMLRRQNLLLDTALENMAQGLAMFDADERIVVANDRFAEMYGLYPEQVKPGTTLRRILQLRIDNGLYVGVTADCILKEMRERVAHKTVSHMKGTLGDGRTITVSIRPRPDGGWVTTHQDITEYENLNAKLAQQNELLKEREEELKAQNLRLDTALKNMSHGLCMFDAEQRVLIANDRYARMYGLSAEDVKPGTPLRDIVERRIARGIYAYGSPDAYMNERLAAFHEASAQVQRLSDGRDICIARQPMRGGGWVTTHEDITEREKLKRTLAQQNEQLDAALNNMSQALAMFDEEQRLVVCNRRYAEMYGLSSGEVKPGTTVRQIMEYRVAKGCYNVTDPAGFIDTLVNRFGKLPTDIHRLADGRIIHVTYRRTAAGGHVITHEDITERERLNAQLEQQNHLLTEQEEKLKSQNVQLDAALNNMVQGLAMFDADMRLVIANDRYAQLYGLAHDKIRPGTPVSELLGDEPGKAAGDLLSSMLVRAGSEHPVRFISQLSDGRFVAIAVQRLPDGGTVTTHQDITEQRRSEAKIAHMAMHDSLTGLPNRVLLNDRLEAALARVRRGEMVAVHLFDLDHFKNVNDTLGHPTGDKLLQAVAKRLRTVIRETDTVARMGGDEFAIVQVAIRQPSEATALAHRVIEVVGEPYDIDGHQVIIGTSVGIATGPADGSSPEKLIRNADLALYRAKGDGRGTYRFFEPAMDAQVQERRTMEYDLRKALLAGEFELHYQPVVNLETSEISGFEALIRWHHPERGMIPPPVFIPVAEEIGFINALGEWAIRHACTTAAKWPEHLRISTNLSPVQFRNPRLVQIVTGALTASGLRPDRLELEVTETALLGDSEATLATLFRLRGLGVRIAMDDFGTGYSSLSYLQSFPFDKIKIDRSFIADITDGVGSLNIVRAVTALANGLGMTTTAEGVETEEQLRTVRAEGCTEMQGYLFSGPRPAHEIERLYLSQPERSEDADAASAA